MSAAKGRRAYAGSDNRHRCPSTAGRSWLVGPLDLNRRDASDGVKVSVNVRDGQAPGFGGGGDQEIGDGRTLVVAKVDKTVPESVRRSARHRPASDASPKYP
jgi:hypothetical protein